MQSANCYKINFIVLIKKIVFQSFSVLLYKLYT